MEKGLYWGSTHAHLKHLQDFPGIGVMLQFSGNEWWVLPPLCVSLVNTSKQCFAYISFWNFESPVDFIWICVIQRGTFINLLYECAHVCLWPLESKRGHQTPQSLSYRWLWAMQCGSLAGAKCTLYDEAISPPNKSSWISSSSWAVNVALFK